MLDVHIDEFFKDCAVILLQGFRRFPARQILYVEDICGPQEQDEFGLNNPRHMAALGAVIWLQEEGYIRYTEMNRQESVDDFVLTSRSFRALLSSPDSIPAQTLAQSLEDAVMNGESLQINRLVRDHFLSFQ